MNVWSKFTWFIFHFHYSFIFYQASIEELKLNRYDNSWNYLIVYLTFHSVVCVCVLADFLYSVRYRENSSEFVSWSRAANDRNAFYESRWTRCRWCSGVYVVQDSQLTTLRTCMLALHSLWFVSSHICDILMDIHVILSSPVPRTFCLMFHKKTTVSYLLLMRCVSETSIIGWKNSDECWTRRWKQFCSSARQLKNLQRFEN